jgi:predicted nucleic acid-binding protein
VAEESGAHHAALFCDTNVLVRILSGDPREQAEAAARALGAPAQRIVVTDLVVAELAYILVGQAGMSPPDAATEIRRILEIESVVVASEDILSDTLDVWAETGVDFQDAYLAALSRQTLATAVLSFHRDFDRIEGVDRVDPATY